MYLLNNLIFSRAMSDPSIFNIDIDMSEVHVAPKHTTNKRFLFSYVDKNTLSLQIDNSSLEVFTTCPRSAEYKLVHARTKQGRAALVAGGAVHAGLETFYNGLSVAGYNTDLVQRAVRAAQLYYESQNVSFVDWRDPSRVCDTVMRYCESHQREPFEILLDKEGLPCVEMAFSLPLGVIEFDDEETIYNRGMLIGDLPADEDPTAPLVLNKVQIYWTGKIDLAIRSDGQHFVMDHKTCSMMGQTFWDNFQLSNQTVGYTWAAEQIFKETFAGLLVNAIYWRPPTAKSIITTEFHRQRFFYDAQQVLEWEHNVHAAVSDFLSNLARGYFPMYTAWCQGKFGACGYFETCSMPSNYRLMDLMTNHVYSDSEWSPLNE